MKKALVLTLICAIGLLTSGCGGCFWILGFGGCPQGTPVDDRKAPEMSLIYGHLDMSDAPTPVDWLDMKQVHPKIKKPYYPMRLDGGMFYFENVPRGSFQLTHFGGVGGFGGNRHEYDIPRQSKAARLRVSSPGIHYIGSFKYKDVKTGFFEQNKFDVETVSNPGEMELLQKLLEHTKGTKWQAAVRARLKELQR